MKNFRITWYRAKYFPSRWKWLWCYWNHGWLVGFCFMGLCVEWENTRFV